MTSTDDRTLLEKLRAHYHGKSIRKDTSLPKMINLYFHWVSFTELYILYYYALPFYYPDQPWTRYLLKVGACHTFVNALAHWFFTRTYTSRLVSTRDNPYFSRSLWSRGNSNNEELKLYGAEYLDRWSSLPECERCNLPKPIRTHHCKVCDSCVLRRDHHCFFMGTCIGYYNQRHFVAFNYFTTLASFIGGYYVFYFLYHHHSDTGILNGFYRPEALWDYFLPVSLYKLLLFRMPPYFFCLVVLSYTLWWTGPFALAFFLSQLFVIHSGLTSYEFFNNKPRPTATGSAPHSGFVEIFGRWWMLNAIFPTQVVFRQAVHDLPVRH